jgi:tetratricopeptide (TPR) repeat protein
MSRDVRSKIGESLKDIRETKPLERVSTPSLAALRKYVEGNRLIDEAVDYQRGIPLLQEAVALDSGFAMAWRKIAVAIGNTALNRAGQMEAAATAYRHRDRLSETERLLTEAYFWSSGPTPDREKSIAAYEALIEADSNNATALNNVSLMYAGKRDFERSKRALHRAAQAGRPTAQAFLNLVNTQVRLGEIPAAESTAALFAARIPGSAAVWSAAWTVSWGRGDLARADSLAKAAYSEAKAPQNVQAGASRLAATAYLRGKVREGIRWDMEENGSVYRRTQAPDRLLLMMMDSARYIAHFLDDRPRASAIIRRALEHTPMTQVPAPQRPWNNLVQLAAMLRDPKLAREAVDGFERDLPEFGSGNPEGDRARFRGFAAVAAGQYADAIAGFREADRVFAIQERVAMISMAQAFDLGGQPDSAVAYFERFLTTPSTAPFQDDFFRAGSYKRLGELYEAKGDTAKAESNYAQFVELWKDADPELQPKVRDVRDRLARLRRGRG